MISFVGLVESSSIFIILYISFRIMLGHSWLQASSVILMVLEGKTQPKEPKLAWTSPEVVAVIRMLSTADKAYATEIDLIWAGDTNCAEYAAIIDGKVNSIMALAHPE